MWKTETETKRRRITQSLKRQNLQNNSTLRGTGVLLVYVVPDWLLGLEFWGLLKIQKAKLKGKHHPAFADWYLSAFWTEKLTLRIIICRN